MKPREAPINRWKSGSSQQFGRSWHAGAVVPPPRRKTGGDEEPFAYGISGADAVASPVSAADDSDRSDLDATAEFSEGDKEGGEDAFGVPRNLHSAPAMRRTDASPMRFSFPDESFENSPSVQRPAQTTVRIRSTETVVTGGVNAEQYTLYTIEVHAPMGDWSVKRRFNDFIALNKDVALRHPRTTLPSLPGRRWFGSLSPDTVKHRKWDLEQYLSSLLKLPRICSSELILSFLEATTDACALRKELADARQQVQLAINQHELAVNAQVKVDTEHDQLVIKLQKARDDLALVQRQYQKGEEELAQLAPKINDQAGRLEKNTQKLQQLRSDIREKNAEIESMSERMMSLDSQRSELEQQLTESKLHCGNKQRELDAKHELIALAEQQLLQKDELIQQEMRRLEDAKLRKIKVSQALESLRMRSMEFDYSAEPSPSARPMEFHPHYAAAPPSSASPSSPNSLCGRFSPMASSHAGSSDALDLPPRASSEVVAGAALAQYRSGLFEVSKGTFSNARTQALGSSQ